MALANEDPARPGRHPHHPRASGPHRRPRRSGPPSAHPRLPHRTHPPRLGSHGHPPHHHDLRQSGSITSRPKRKHAPLRVLVAQQGEHHRTGCRGVLASETWTETTDLAASADLAAPIPTKKRKRAAIKPDPGLPPHRRVLPLRHQLLHRRHLHHPDHHPLTTPPTPAASSSNPAPNPFAWPSPPTSALRPAQRQSRLSSASTSLLLESNHDLRDAPRRPLPLVRQAARPLARRPPSPTTPPPNSSPADSTTAPPPGSFSAISPPRPTQRSLARPPRRRTGDLRPGDSPW